MIRIDDWALVDDEPDSSPHRQTLFNLSNGFLGIRGSLEEDGDIADQTFINGFYETWPISYPEDAYGFARVGQTIQPIPNPTSFHLCVNGTIFNPQDAHLRDYTRRLDFRTGKLSRSFTWTTPDEISISVSSSRLVSFVERGVAVMEYTVRPTQDCDIELTNSLVFPHVGADADGLDPRRSTQLDSPVHIDAVEIDPFLAATFSTIRSGMSMAWAVSHQMIASCPYQERSQIDEDKISTHVTAHLCAEQSLTMIVLASVGTDLDTASQVLLQLSDMPWTALAQAQKDYLDRWWQAADVTVECSADPNRRQDLQGKIRWNLFQALQASARADGLGIAAKGVSGSGYDGHYFWDCEAMVLPFLTYTCPEIARHALSYRYSTLDLARQRAQELHQKGAAFPWRTIDGHEASAFFEAGTAQYHINADIAYAINRYLLATDDLNFLATQGIDLLIETARMWVDLGFYGSDGGFHIHGVTGPDEYSAMVDDNLYTNVMAAANLHAANQWLDTLAARDPERFHESIHRLHVSDEERHAWEAAAFAMAIPFDTTLGIHAQDAHFLTHEKWDFAATAPEMYPLLLHYHPLTIYRHQVLKQTDVVSAILTRPDLFTPEQKLADFDYYDAITTGDSTLSASTQAIVATEVGHIELATSYFEKALNTDLDDTHSNASDGVHVASAGALWATLVMGFGGLRDYGKLSLDPRLPSHWERLIFRLRFHNSIVNVEVSHGHTGLTLVEGDPFELTVSGENVHLTKHGQVVLIPSS